MSLKKLPYKSLQHLLWVNLCTKEYPKTEEIIKEFAPIRRRGYLTKGELAIVCRWKSPRVLGHIRRNRADTIKRVTGEAFATRNERDRINVLTTLHGVGKPMASSILMLTDPIRYGVIDIRVWQLLHKAGAVATNIAGVGFTTDQWTQFLSVIRMFAKKYKVKARDIERTLFMVHERFQKGALYGR